MLKDNNMTMKKAAVIQFASKYSSIAANLVIVAVLARLVTPEEFGLLAIVTIFTTFFNSFANMGLGVAIIQFRDLTEGDYGKLFTFSLLLAVLLVVGFCFLSIPVSLFYGNSELIPLCCFASVSLFFSTVNTVPNGLILKDRQFVSIGLRLIVTTVISGAVGIVLALFGFGCYALVAQIVMQAASVFFWNVIKRPIRQLSIHFMMPLKRIFSYTLFQIGYTVINYFSQNIDNIVIGKALGVTSLGFYDKAYKLTTYPISAFSAIASSVIQPFMAEQQDNKKAIFDCWVRVAKLISLLAAPLCVLLFCSSESVVVLFYGPQWEIAVPLFHALSITVYFQMVNSLSSAFFQTLGRTDLMFKSGVITTVLTIAGLVVGLFFGNLLAVSWGIAVAYVLHTAVICYFLIGKALSRSVKELKVFLPEFVIGILGALICTALDPVFSTNLILRLLEISLVLFVLFLAGYLLCRQLKYIKSVMR